MARTNHRVIIVANSVETRRLHQLRARARYWFLYECWEYMAAVRI